MATYYKKEKLTHCKDVKQQFFQLTKLSSPEIDVVSVYRSKEGNKHDLMLHLKAIIEGDKPTIVCGDFNFCLLDSASTDITAAMEKLGFYEYAKCATHIKGGHIDHMYFR